MDIERFLKYEMNNMPPILLAWAGTENIKNSIRSKLMDDYAFLYDDEAAGEYMSNINYENTHIEDYYAHFIELDYNHALISSINFRKERGNFFPFIQIIHKNFDFFSIGKHELEKIISWYEVFNPEFIRFYEHDFKESMTIQDYIITGESIVAAGHINTIRQQLQPQRFSEISLEIVHDMGFYEEYSREYDDFLKENMYLKNFLNKESYETMKRLVEINFVYKIIIKGETAGIFAVDKTIEKYFSSFMVVEEVLYKKYRGRGYAPAAQRKIIDTIIAGSSEMIQGTIHPQNLASLKTALKNNRVLIGTNYLLLLKN
jgi:hypothetical protein